MSLSRILSMLFASLLMLVGTTARADLLEDIIERGTLRVGVAEFVPWTIRTQAGDLIGFEIDVGNKLAQDMGVEADFRVYVWDEMIPALQRGEIDVIAGGMAITPARALSVNFSRPLATSGVGIATNTALTQNIRTLDGLNEPDIVVATVADTLAAAVSDKLFNRASVKIYKRNDLAQAEVLEGRAHVYLASMPEAVFLTLRNERKIDLPIDEPLIASSEALAIKKGEQEWLNFLDAWVTARKSDKWLQSSRDYWFRTLDWRPDVRD